MKKSEMKAQSIPLLPTISSHAYSILLEEMFGRYSKPAHMFPVNARASQAGLLFLRYLL